MKKVPILMVICIAYTIAFAQPLPDKWSITPGKTKNASGRLWMDFPVNKPDVDTRSQDNYKGRRNDYFLLINNNK